MLARKALAGTAGAPKLYVEDVMSCFLYTGNGSTQTITNNIDLSGEGGLVWIKNRDGANGHFLFDTARAQSYYYLQTQSDNAQGTGISSTVTAFNNNGFSLGSYGGTNGTISPSFASWTFRKAKKFFDVVTYTGTGSARTVSHNLGSVPGCIIIKKTDNTGGWVVYHRSLGATKYLGLDVTDSANTFTGIFNDTEPTSTVFTVGTSAGTNGNGNTYVAYLFAHNAGGFGDAGSDNVITCGSYTTDGSGKATINLGYEPQWLLVKGSSFASNWFIVDTMRGLDATSLIKPLYANSSVAEDTDNTIGITSTGFTATTGSSLTFVYIAIRRGPMKTPTSGTSVYTPIARTGTGATATVTGVGFPSDLVLLKNRSSATAYDWNVYDRLRGATIKLATNSTNLESTETNGLTSLANMDGYTIGPANEINASTVTFINYSLRRAPGFFDVVCYTGTGSNTTVTHNLGVAPELIIIKRRSSVNNWLVYNAISGNQAYLLLNDTGAVTTGASTVWNSTSPTSSVFSLGTNATGNASGETYVAYLFASLSGVSKVGSFTGNGSSVTVTTGFQPRFIMVKRTDSTGNWIVGDSARGLVSADEPALFLNSTAAETTGQDWVDVSSTGFTVNETALNANVNTATYIYLCVA